MDSKSNGVEAAIVADDLTRSFNGQIALDGLTLDAQPGEVLAVLGPNGAGKTTTVRLLNGVLAPDRGSSRVLGLDPAHEGNEVRRRTGVLTENAGLDDRLTAWENLVVTGRIRGMSTAEAGEKATAMLERFGMAERADDRVQGFSTGQRKRVALGRALLHDPDVLFLDEPTSGLDPEATRDVIDLIGSLATEHGRTVVLCTHFLGEAGRLAHRMAVLDQGRLLAFGTPAELAGSIWKGLDVGLDLGAAADETLHRDPGQLEGSARRACDRHRRAPDGDRPLGDPSRGRIVDIPGDPRVRSGPHASHARGRLLRRRERQGRGSESAGRRGAGMSARIDVNAIRAVMWKDLTAVKRSKAVVLPMLLVPLLLFVMLPGAVGLAARAVTEVNVDGFLGRLPGNVAAPIRELPEREQLVVLVNGYLLAPLFLIVPLMVSVVLAADAFAGEKERKTIEGLLHLPISDRDLFLAKLLGAFIPAVVVSWVGFLCFALVTNTIAWPVMHRVFVPTRLWGVMILWVAPAVAALGLGVMVRVSARARTSQEANQLGGAVILPLIFIALGQATGLLLVALPVALTVGAVLWLVAAWLVHGGITKFSRDRIALRV